ncbi:hypothetical protein [Thalassovita sp.]|uniref:hypothetical protein n=1 Tax=Thalassovita sp. TaxID=1979401 RepID=UPI002AB26CC5|nr:hypothetical protein [Thalassovita sp.]
MQSSRFALMSAFGATSAAFTAPPALAQVDVWQLLDQIEIEEVVTETTYEVKKSLPAEIDKGLQGVEITGFAVPTYPGETVTELLLVSDMGLCPLCGSGDHGATLQVMLEDPIPGFEAPSKITLRGDLQAVRDPETWQAAILTKASVLAPTK